MKRIMISITAVSLVIAIGAGVISAVLYFEKKKGEDAEYALAYTQASFAAERLASSLDGAYESFFASDISSVNKYASMLSMKLSELSLESGRLSALHRYLSLVGEISQNSLRLLDEGKMSEYYKNLFGRFSSYARRLDDEFMPSIDTGADYDLLDNIFADLGMIYYDGAYSDESGEEVFTMLRDAPVLSLDELDEIAEDIFGDGAKLSRTHVHSFPDVYSYSCANASIDISGLGGYVFRILYDRRPTDGECSARDAERAMREFLAERGMEELVLCEIYERGDYFGVFAPTVKSDAGEILCISASVKLCVGRDTGRVAAYDAEDYFKYYKREREVGDVACPDGAHLVYIITSNGRETLCYRRDGEYYNAESGRAETKIY